MQTLSSFKGSSEGVAKSWQTRRQNKQKESNQNQKYIEAGKAYDGGNRIGAKVWGGTKGSIKGAAIGAGLGLTAGAALANKKVLKNLYRLSDTGANPKLINRIQRTTFDTSQEVADKVKDRYLKRYTNQIGKSTRASALIGATGGAGYGTYKGAKKEELKSRNKSYNKYMQQNK